MEPAGIGVNVSMILKQIRQHARIVKKTGDKMIKINAQKSAPT
jgi:hypothetical protein